MTDKLFVLGAVKITTSLILIIVAVAYLFGQETGVNYTAEVTNVLECNSSSYGSDCRVELDNGETHNFSLSLLTGDTVTYGSAGVRRHERTY